MSDPSHLADKSVLARASLSQVAERLAPLIQSREVATCSVVDLEVLFSARTPRDHAQLRAELDATYPKAPITQAAFDRAIEVQSLLAARSVHRGVSIPDLIIAATAEGAGLTVLHYDSDFDLIAEVTGQPVEWVVPAGSVD